MRSPIIPKIGTVAIMRDEKEAEVRPVPRFSIVKYTDIPIAPAMNILGMSAFLMCRPPLLMKVQTIKSTAPMTSRTKVNIAGDMNPIMYSMAIKSKPQMKLTPMIASNGFAFELFIQESLAQTKELVKRDSNIMVDTKATK